MTEDDLFAWLPRAEQTRSVIGPTAPPAPRVPKQPGVLGRTWEWFWRGRAMAEVRREGTAGSPRAAELVRRGWLALEVANRTQDPRARFAGGSPDAVAWELSRQAVYWALRADRLLATNTDDRSLGLGALVEGARPRLLAAAGGETELSLLEPELSGRSLAEQSELPPEEQSRSARAMSRLARALLLELERPLARLDHLWFQRLSRAGGLLVLLVLVGVGISLVQKLMLLQRDVARGKPWHASSVFTATTSCPSPQQECAESPFFFFHTLDEDHPWLELDLGSKQRIVGATLENRVDCCAERAVPIAIQVSTDHRNWKEVVRRTEVFGTWSPRFAPVQARWVRLQLLKRTSFHLHRVSILR